MGYCDVIMGYCDVIIGYCDVIMGYCDVIIVYCDVIKEYCDFIIWNFVCRPVTQHLNVIHFQIQTNNKMWKKSRVVWILSEGSVQPNEQTILPSIQCSYYALLLHRNPWQTIPKRSDGNIPVSASLCWAHRTSRNTATEEETSWLFWPQDYLN